LLLLPPLLLPLLGALAFPPRGPPLPLPLALLSDTVPLAAPVVFKPPPPPPLLLLLLLLPTTPREAAGADDAELTAAGEGLLADDAALLELAGPR